MSYHPSSELHREAETNLRNVVNIEAYRAELAARGRIEQAESFAHLLRMGAVILKNRMQGRSDDDVSDAYIFMCALLRNKCPLNMAIDRAIEVVTNQGPEAA